MALTGQSAPLNDWASRPSSLPMSANVGVLAGSDRDRAGDLMKMFTDPEVKAIMCLRGGYGTARLLPLLDYQAIRANAKIIHRVQ